MFWDFIIKYWAHEKKKDYKRTAQRSALEKIDNCLAVLCSLIKRLALFASLEALKA